MRTASLLAVVALAVFAAAPARSWAADEERGEDVPYRIVPIEAYAVFVNNWENDGQPFCAVVRSLDDWDKVFSPAMSMGEQRPVRPDAALFDDESLLVVARVAPAAEGAVPVLSVVSLERVKNGCVLAYRFVEPAPASYSVKHTLILAIPKGESGPFRFVERHAVATLE